jgi:trigger factor
MKKLLETHEFEVPERLVRFEVEQMIKQTEEQLEKSGMDLESAGLNREELAKNNEPIAIQRVTGDFILKKIAEVEEIKVQDEDLDRAFKRIGDQYSMPVDRVKEFFKSRDDLLPLMNEVLNEKILNFLKEEAQLQKPSKKDDKETAAEEPHEPEASSEEKDQ